MALPIPFPTEQLIQMKTSVGHARDLWTPASFDYDVFEDCFFGGALNVRYASAKTNGASAARTFTAGNTNGYLELVSGTADNGYAGTAFSLSWTGDRGCLLEAILKTPADITDFKFEVGLTDTLSDDAGAINAKATPSFNATDCAIFVYDTDDNTVLDFISANAGTGVATTGVLAAGILVASTTYRFAVRVETNSVSAWLNGNRVVGGTHSIAGASKLTPWFFCQARASSESKTLQVHKWRMTQPAY